MRALRRLYADSVLDQNQQSDVLQETLINVGAAYPGMYIYGGYGPMINPVSACATAAVSVEVGTDLLHALKQICGVAFDTSVKRTICGDASHHQRSRPKCKFDQISSRPCDARRGVFVEAQAVERC